MDLISPEYQQALVDLHKNSWGTTGAKYAGPAVVAVLNTYPEIQTILDYGCGEATLKKYVDACGIKKDWTLYDPGVPQYQKRPEGKFDLVITTDVLEHVEESKLDAVLADLEQFTGRFLFNDIACYLANRQFQDGPYKGQDYHINLRAPDGWLQRIGNLGMSKISRRIEVLEGWKVRCLMIHER